MITSSTTTARTIKPGVPLRLPIHDVARSKAGGLGVGGKLEGGAIRVGSKVALLPGGEVGVVKSIEVNGQVGRFLGITGGRWCVDALSMTPCFV